MVNTKKARSNEPRALNQIAALPFLLPTRLAVGLELEVFYASLLDYEHLTTRPCFAPAKRWFPRITCDSGTGNFGRQDFNERDVTLTQ